MRYLMLIYGNEQAAMQSSEEEQRAGFDAWMQFDQEIQAAGVTSGGEALQPTSTATTVADGGGEPLVTDGPFAETREQLGGYYVLDVPNLDEAIKWAHKCAAATDTVKLELRPIMEFDQG
jgi:hypothetical protein